MDSLAYILIPAAIFIVFGVLTWLTTRRSPNRTASLSKAERRYYPVALWCRILAVITAGIMLAIAYDAYHATKDLDDTWLGMLIFFGPIFLGMIIPVLITVFRSHVEIKDGTLYYHNGFWLRKIPLNTLIECRKDPASFTVVVGYKGKPNKRGKTTRRISIAPCYKHSGEWVEILQMRSVRSRGRENA